MILGEFFDQRPGELQALRVPKAREPLCEVRWEPKTQCHNIIHETTGRRHYHRHIIDCIDLPECKHATVGADSS
ncbi:hypothetical protein JMUB6875_41280 [Nocardia sp. JMUB6875]